MDTSYALSYVFIPNGQSDGRDTHISVYVYLMRGEFDDHLDWPLRSTIIVELQSTVSATLGASPTKMDTIRFSGNAPSSDHVVGQERAETGRGQPKFVSHMQ